MLHAITAAFLAGLVGSPHCVGMCGPFAVACGGRASQALAWQTGKASTYALLGAAAGAFGAALPGPTWLVSVVSGALVVWFAAALAGLVPEPRLRVPGVQRLAIATARRDDLPSRFLFGAANGLLPCGLVYAALGLAIATGGASTGALAMLAFGLGSAPALVAFALGARRLIDDRPWARKALACVVLITGLWVVVQRTGMSTGGLG